MPSVSIILLVWDNTEYIFSCLNALREQTYNDFEVILVDNGSSDVSYLFEVNTMYSNLVATVERLNTNVGFTAGNNIGVKHATGEWVALLNVDAFPQPDWLEKLLQGTKKYPGYSFYSSRQLQYRAPDLLDGAGDSYHMTGLAWRRYYNKPVAEYGFRAEEVFSACPAAALYSREEFLKTGGFDEDYFSYFEDVDLGFRLRLSGAKCLYVPDAVVHHVGSASTGKRSDFSVYYGYRNMIWTFFKDMPSPYFWLFLPLHVLAVFFFLVYLTLRGQGRVIWKAIFDAIHGMPNVLRKRKVIQRNKKVKDRDLIKAMSTGFWEPYREFAKRNLNK